MEVAPKAYYNNIYNAFTHGHSYIWGERSGIEQTVNWRINAQQQLQAGLGWQKYQDIEAGSLPQPFNPSASVTGQGMLYPNTTLPLLPLDASFHNASAYAQLQTQWSAQLSSVVGLRVDRHAIDQRLHLRRAKPPPGRGL